MMNKDRESQSGSQNHADDVVSSGKDNAKNQGMQSSPDNDGDSTVESIIKVIEESCIEIFLDQFSEPYAFIKEGNKVMGVNASDFEDHILLNCLKKNRKIISGESLKNAIKIIRAKAAASNSVKKMFVRAARDADNNFWYDLGRGKAVKINQDGWSIAIEPPSFFKRFKSQLPQVEPVRGGNLDEFLSIVNVTSKDDEILLKVYLVSSFIYGYSHPVLIVYGEQGTAKTSLFRFLKALIDPSSIETLSPITNIKEFIQVISHHWAAYFDNFSSLKAELSDALCRACTGDGFSKRRLYSNDDDMIYSFQHVVGVNGINNVASKSDLLNRSLLIELARIPEDQRKTEEAIQKKFDAMRVGIIGVCFDAIVKAIKIYPTVKIAKPPRMSDFSTWGFAIAEGLGIGGEKFLEVYRKNIFKQNLEAIEASPVAYAVKTMIDNEIVGVIEATPMYIFNRLIREATSAEIDYTRDRSWPTNVRWFVRKLTEVIPNLEKIGIKISKGKSEDRWLKIEKVAIKEQTNCIFTGNSMLVRADEIDNSYNDGFDQARSFERGEIGREKLDVSQFSF